MSVELIGLYGSDEIHALSAWTSTSREIGPSKRNRIPSLLKFLARNKHETPFEKSSLHFLVKTDIATHIHLLKHRIGVSISGESARYRELPNDTFHVPDDWPVKLKRDLEETTRAAFAKYHEAVDALEAAGLTPARARESARFYLPYNSMITADIMFNFRSFMHFIGLRAAPDAQLEVRELALEMLRLIREDGRFTHSLAAYEAR